MTDKSKVTFGTTKTLAYFSQAICPPCHWTK